MESKEWSCMEELVKLLIQVDQDLARNPPIDDYESLSLQYNRGPVRGVVEHSSCLNKGGASNPS